MTHLAVRTNLTCRDFVSQGSNHISKVGLILRGCCKTCWRPSRWYCYEKLNCVMMARTSRAGKFEDRTLPLKLRNGRFKESPAAGWRWPHLAGGRLGFHRLLQATASVDPGCQHTPQADKSFEICKQARHFNHQREEIRPDINSRH